MDNGNFGIYLQRAVLKISNKTQNTTKTAHVNGKSKYPYKNYNILNE